MERFEELKFVHERTQRLSERRQIASQIYLTINTIIFGALTFLSKDFGLQGWSLIWVSLPFFCVGVIVCSIWNKIIWRLESIIGWNYEQVREIEGKIPDSHLVITKEWEQFYKEKGKKRFTFSELESQLPKLLMGLYIIYLTSLMILILLSQL